MIDIWQIRRALIHGINEVLGTPGTEPVTGLGYIAVQVREVFMMFACGACVAFLYRVYDGVLKRSNERGRIIILTDILFCLAAGVLILQFWYGSSYGRLSVHEGAGLAAGIWLGAKAFRFGKSKRVHTIAFVYVIMLVTAYILIS